MAILSKRSNKLILQGDPESTIFALRQVLEVRPYDKEARNILAFALKEAGKNKEAKKVLDKSRDEKLEN